MNDDEFRERIENLHQLQELAQHPGWPILIDFAHYQMAAKQRRLISGSVKTMDDYQRLCGWLDGAETVLKAAEYAASEVEAERATRQEQDDMERSRT